jgi:hypothetical protein
VKQATELGEGRLVGRAFRPERAHRLGARVVHGARIAVGNACDHVAFARIIHAPSVLSLARHTQLFVLAASKRLELGR